MNIRVNYLENAPRLELKPLVHDCVRQSLDEVVKLLPELPESINIWLGDAGIIHNAGVGGTAYASDVININFDTDFINKALQLEHLRGIIFHESYHLVQGHVLEDVKVIRENMLDNAVYEGAASIFEREYATVDIPWSDYSSLKPAQMDEWQEFMQCLSVDDYWSNNELWRKWAFYDPDDGIRWKVYRVGSRLVEKALDSSELSIVDLRSKDAREIISMALEGQCLS